MACTNPQNPNCANCNKAGLAILPARYAVVPKTVSASLPNTLGNKVTDTKIEHHKYALRTLRKGFFYIYYEKHPRGSQYKWEVYGVAPQGTLWKQLAITALNHINDEPACARNGDNIPASVINIEKPEEQGKVWLAFSEHAWSAETFKDFDADVAKRDERMQTFEPKLWVASKGYKHGLDGTVANIEQIIEYQDNFVEASLTGGNAVPEASEENGRHKDVRLKKQSTRHSLYMRKDQSKKVAALMKQIGEGGKGKPHEPMVMAVWDAVGIAHELNGFRNDAAGVIEQYGKERELQITAMNAIDGVKKALAEKTGKAADDMAQNMNQLPMHNLDQKEAMARSTHRNNPVQLQIELDKIAEERLKHIAKRDQTQARVKADHVAHSWDKYQAKLENNGKSYQTFKDNYDAFLSAADILVDERTDDLIKWLEAKSFINAFTEFHPKSIDDGVVFDDQVGTAIHGMNSSIKGQKKIDDWVNEMKATKTNLVWRALALNQEEGIKEVNEALSTAATMTAPIGQLSVDFLSMHVRKWADIYKKANTMQNTLVKAADAAEGIKKIKVTDFDRVFMTVGDRLFKPFLQRGVDKGAEFAVRGLMLARAGVDEGRIIDALKTQAKLEGLARADVVKRLQITKTFIGSGKDCKDIKYAELQKKWEDLKIDSSKGPKALKENRLSLIVATLEIINLTKIGWEFGNDKAKLGELAAAAASATAALMDIAANAAKHLIGEKVSTSFQILKVSGGVLSAGAGYYSMVTESQNSLKNWEKEKYSLAVGYGFKASSQFLSATLGLLGTVSYAAPLMEASGSKAVQWAGGRLLFYRLFCMTWAVRINMVGLAFTFLIWAFTDDALQNWCEECPFGIKKDKGSKNPVNLLKSYSEALIEVV
jgi:hypothetical protein